MVPDLLEVISEDLESELRGCMVGRAELLVDLSCGGLGEEPLTIDEITVLDVQVQVA